jgi:diguanylate cyclase (GGDEF)-like protein
VIVNGGPLARAATARRLFLVYVAVTLVPVLLLGSVLFVLLTREGNSRALAEARAKASLIAQSVIAPLLGDADLRRPLTATEQADLVRSVSSSIHDRAVLRLRLRNLDGVVIFSDDGTAGGADDEALQAAAGHTVSELTYLNDDDNDSGPRGPRGPRVVEVYQPLRAPGSGARIGVLEMYLPYPPIAADIAHGQRTVLAAMALGLMLLWLCLLGVSVSTMRRLHREAAANAFLASHDLATGLPNRAAFIEHISPDSREPGPDSQPRYGTVAVLNLDRFRAINDALGYANGDRVITIVVERLRAGLRHDDVLARTNGDEFAIGLTGARDAEVVLGALRAAVGAPFVVNDIPITVQAAVGYVSASAEASSPDALLRQAAVAVQVAKTEHRGVVAYCPEQESYDSTALTLVAELVDAIDDGQLVLHYQPKGDLRTLTVTAFEALVRWQHPTRGLLLPDAFLPQVEQTELIDDLTRWVLRTVGESLPGLDPSGTVSVAVNVSACSLARPDFAQEVIEELGRSGTDPRRVILELTETAILVDPPRARQTLTDLHGHGLRISIDDFGAGQTSLSYLATMPLAELKIDKAFVLSMDTDPRNAAIVRSVIELGHSLGLRVVAEGVETEHALRGLTALGCDTAQGFLLSPPVAADEICVRRAAAEQRLAAAAVPAIAAGLGPLLAS